MNYKDIKKNGIYCVRFRVIEKGDFAFTADAINENGLPVKGDTWHFTTKDAAVLIPCEQLEAPTIPAVKVKLDTGATMPRKAHSTDVGYDVTVCKVEYRDRFGKPADVDRCPSLARTIIVDTGVHVEPPSGYYFELVPNSRIAKTPFFMANSPGIIDPDYRGSIKAVYKALDGEVFSKEIDMFRPGKVIGQLILHKLEDLPMVQVDTLTETERGNGGFGSTAK